MNRRELAKKISQKTEVSEKKVLQVMEVLTMTVLESLRKGEPVVIHKFGTFKPVVRKRKKARNLKTGEQIVIPSYRTIKFIPSISVKIL